jgi:ABC-type nickel/cobalt efflux system permease component RcnA
LAIALSMLLGAGHAFLPGHGKTVMAAYLVGRRGRLRDVATVGATVTITHTVGVLVLGLLIALGSQFATVVVEQDLAVVSGGTVALVGAGLLVSALRRRRAERAMRAMRAMRVQHLHHLDVDTHEAAQALLAAHHAEVAVLALAGHATALATAPVREPVHEHPHHDHPHPHPEEPAGLHRHGWGTPHAHGPSEKTGQSVGFSRGGLIGLGAAGGLVPSPSALLVLLAAVTAGRTLFGISLVLAYGLGMALALCAAGLLVVKLQDRMIRLLAGRKLARLGWVAAAMPVLTASLVLVVGVGLMARAISGSV